MDTATILSKNGVSIRLTKERWKHIVLMHPNLIDKQKQVLTAVKSPDYILKGKEDELLAVCAVSQRKHIVVVYKEEMIDGFIITAFETTDTRWLFKKEILWSRPS